MRNRSRAIFSSILLNFTLIFVNSAFADGPNPEFVVSLSGGSARATLNWQAGVSGVELLGTPQITLDGQWTFDPALFGDVNVHVIFRSQGREIESMDMPIIRARVFAQSLQAAPPGTDAVSLSLNSFRFDLAACLAGGQGHQPPSQYDLALQAACRRASEHPEDIQWKLNVTLNTPDTARIASNNSSASQKIIAEALSTRVGSPSTDLPSHAAK